MTRRSSWWHGKASPSGRRRAEAEPTARPARRPARLHSVFARVLHEQRRALLGWTSGLTLLAVWMLALYPTVRDTGMSKLVADFPETLRRMFNLDDYSTGAGYLRAEVFSLMGPLLLIILAVLSGSDAIAGEEESGTIDLLLANPLPRWRVVAEKWVATAAELGVAAATLGLVLAGGGTIVGLDVGLIPLLHATASTWLLALLFGTIALVIGSATGRRGFARGTSAALVVAAYLLSSVGSLVSWLRPLRLLSPWYHALGVDPLRGAAVGHLVLLAGAAVALAVLAALLFEQRDLAV